MNRLRNRRALMYAGVGVAAAVVAVVLILVSVLGSSGKKNATTTSGQTTGAVSPLPGAAETAQVFRGIPQKLETLGKAQAPVTMIEFADLQCPYCKDFALDALPSVVRTFVRTGKVKVVFYGLSFIGPDSEKGLRAVFAAGLQGKLWNFLDLLYRNQGAENSGWLTDDLLRRVGASIPGFDTAKMLKDTHSAAVDTELTTASQQAATAGVNSTPSFFAGPTDGTLQPLDVSSLTPDAFRQALDALTQ